MERFAPELSFGLSATNLNLDAFSAFKLPQTLNSSQSDSAQVALAEDFLRKFSDKIGRGLSNFGAGGDKGSDNPLNLLRNHQVVLNRSVTNASSDFLNDEWLRQAEYDKFMNEIWIGIVLTLIVISMVFCICSCFLYHQFRQWKNNYHRNIQQNADLESVKLSIGDDDLPNYTLVSGLPTYDAALQLFQKSSASSSYLLNTYPSVFKVFASNEKLNTTTQQLSLPSFYVTDPDSSSSLSSTHTQQNRSLDDTPVPSYYDAVFGAHRIEEKDSSGYHEALLSKNPSSADDR